MKVFEGTIITCDTNNTIANYLVEDKGRIVFVGDKLPSEYENNIKIDLGKKVLLPSFADSHMHFASFAIFNAGLNVMNARSNKEILKMLQEYVKGNSDNIIIVFSTYNNFLE